METEIKEDPNEGPPRKRLLTDPNPNHRFITASPESTVSSDSSSDRFSKRTRELPNFSDCHGCGGRINYTNPKDRLQPLDSMWRIVLLCKKCCKLVKSSQLCLYCFSSIDENDCFKCPGCHHSIHKGCVDKYDSGLGLGFSVCVDCWVPDAVANSIRVRKRKCRKKDNESCEGGVTLPESRVSVGEINESDSFGEEVEKKVAVAAKACENAMRKAVVAKNAVGLAKGVLSFVASRKVAGSCETEVVDDKKLAVILHQAINNSPRTSRYACLMSSFRGDDAPTNCYSRKRVKKAIVVNSNSLDVPLMCYCRRHVKGGLRKSASFDAPLMCYYRKRFRSKACSHDRGCECFICKVSESVDKHVPISSGCLKASDCGPSSENSFNGNKCQENDVGRINTKPHCYLLKYYRVGKGIPRPSVFGKDSDCGPSSGNSFNGNKCQENVVGRINTKPHRYLLKYHRVGKGIPRPSVFGKDSDHGSCMEFANLVTEDTSGTRDIGRINTKPHRYLVKYYRVGKGIPRPSVFGKDSDCGSCMEFANLVTEDMSGTRGDIGNGKECHEISKKCDDNSNRFLLKYKRTKKVKPELCCKFAEVSPLLPSNHPKESSTLSDTRFPSSSQGDL